MTTTIVAYLNNLLVIVGIGVLFAILPRFSAYRTLFGTAVERSVEESTVAQLSHRKYVRTVSVFTALALTLSGCGVLFVQRWLLAAGIIVVIGGGALSYVIQWRHFRLHGKDSDGYRVGSLRPARPMRSNWIINGTASLPLLGAALYAALKRGQLPANLPTRWGFDGRVSAWAVNTPFHVVRPAIIGLLSLAFLNIMLWATASFGRIDRNAGDSTLHRTAFIVGAVSLGAFHQPRADHGAFRHGPPDHHLSGDVDCRRNDCDCCIDSLSENDKAWRTYAGQHDEPELEGRRLLLERRR